MILFILVLCCCCCCCCCLSAFRRGCWCCCCWYYPELSLGLILDSCAFELTLRFHLSDCRFGFILIFCLSTFIFVNSRQLFMSSHSSAYLAKHSSLHSLLHPLALYCAISSLPQVLLASPQRSSKLSGHKRIFWGDPLSCLNCQL